MATQKTTPRHRSTRRGIAATEFAMVLPLLLLILFMTIEASRYLMGLHAVAGAAREASRIYAVRGDQTEAETVALDYLQRSSFSINTETFSVSFNRDSSGVSGFDILTCEVVIDYEDVSLIGDPFNLGVNHVTGYSARLAEN